MRSTKHTKILKSGTRAKINKKNSARKSNRSWGLNNEVSSVKLENINEIIRVRVSKIKYNNNNKSNRLKTVVSK